MMLDAGTKAACTTYSYVSASWRACSVTCGLGTATRQVQCQATTGEPVSESSCVGDKPPPTKQCVEASCVSYSWAFSAWGSVSTSCGSSNATRVVVCKASNGGFVGDMFCANSGARPQATKLVVGVACPTYTWKQGAWGGCTLSCGSGGLITRTVSCFNQAGTIADDALCTGSKPATTDVCPNERPCTPYIWNMSTWSPCSVSCGGTGLQRRSVSCVETATNTAASTAKCDGVPPNSDRPCSAAPCTSYSWAFSPWASCPAPCGRATTTRTVICQSAPQGLTASDDKCSGAKPAQSQECTGSLGLVCATPTSPPSPPPSTTAPISLPVYRFAYVTASCDYARHCVTAHSTTVPLRICAGSPPGPRALSRAGPEPRREMCTLRMHSAEPLLSYSDRMTAAGIACPSPCSEILLSPFAQV